ncbi:MAG: tyrosine--tRNA ligase [Candidatus Diapherotrites archaeon]|nr:tyrosine--tRNA ligase [Candidatus Diapherotrites archaeon]
MPTTTAQKLSAIEANTVEIVSKEELQALIEAKKTPIAYCGYEPSGPIHLGHLVTISKLKDLEKTGFRVKILLADWHAFLNKKGTIEEIRQMAKEWEKSIKRLGFKNAEFVLGSAFQMKPLYFEDVLELASHATLQRGLRSMQEVARDIEHAHISQMVYPLMQIADIKHLGVDVAQAGIEQRKIHMLGRELLPQIRWRKPVLVHTPLINSLTGDGKMSSSKPETFISLADSPEQVLHKVNKSFCPEGVVDKNPVIEITRLILFPLFGELEIRRPEKFGGDKTYASATELEKDFAEKKLHPMDLKKACAEWISEMFGKTGSGK